MWPFSLWFRCQSLAEVDKPTKVRLAGRVASANDRASPITGMVAAAIRYTFYARRIVRPRESEPYMYQVLLDGTSLGSLDIKTDHGTLHIPRNACTDLLFPRTLDRGEAVDRPLPQQFASLHDRPELQDAQLCYRELLLTHGDLVRVIATVERTSHSVASPYRQAGGPPFVVRTDLERVIIQDETTSFSLTSRS